MQINLTAEDKRKQRRIRIGQFLDKILPKHFCWAALVGWAYGRKRTFLSVGQEFDIKGGSAGCRSESLSYPGATCMCGKWLDGVYQQPAHKCPKEENTELEIDNLPF